MFTIIARMLASRTALYADQMNTQDRERIYDRTRPEDRMYELLLHAREDLKYIAFLLGAVIVMLGIVADVVLVSVVFSDRIRQFFDS